MDSEFGISVGAYVIGIAVLTLLLIAFPLRSFLKGFMQGLRDETPDNAGDSKKRPAVHRENVPPQRPAASVPVNPAPEEAKISKGPSKVFVCYRRDDSRDVVGRVYDELAKKFGREHVFKDVDSLRLGRDYRDSIEQSVSACDIFIAIIGKRWIEHNPDGIRRIDDSDDPVRIEIETALARDIPVVPVLVSDAVMPKKSTLPDSIEALAYRHGVPVRSDPDFHTDVGRLINGMEQTLAEDA